MSLLLQLNTDLPQNFPGHERRLYIFACRNKACRKKPGTIRAIRGAKVSQISTTQPSRPGNKPTSTVDASSPQPSTNLGDSLFSSTPFPPTNANSNPFSSKSPTLNTKPFSSTRVTNPNLDGQQNPHLSNPPGPPQSLAADADTLPSTFAEKARIAGFPTQAPPKRTSWPQDTSFPSPYPSYHLDADYESLEASPTASPSKSSPTPQKNNNTKIDESDYLDGYESSSDTTFLRFALRLAQNPEQVLRYEFGGQPLLYSKTDSVGQSLSSASAAAASLSAIASSVGTGAGSRIPNCANCGAKRVFE
ncbi:MAG: hypothetical protein Q9190_006337, partial [Brigantiaea leucoxantha]